MNYFLTPPSPIQAKTRHHILHKRMKALQSKHPHCPQCQSTQLCMHFTPGTAAQHPNSRPYHAPAELLCLNCGWLAL